MNRRSLTTRPGISGFTLLELILVLVLIAVLTTLATPALSGFARRAALDDTAVSLLLLIQQAQTRAVHTATTHRVVFDLDQREAWVDTVGEEGYEHVVGAGVETVTWGRSITLTADIEPNGYERLTLSFEPTGLVTPGSIVIEQDGSFVALTCDAPTERYRLLTPSELLGRNAEGVLNAMRF